MHFEISNNTANQYDLNHKYTKCTNMTKYTMPSLCIVSIDICINKNNATIFFTFSNAVPCRSLDTPGQIQCFVAFLSENNLTHPLQRHTAALFNTQLLYTSFI